MSDRSSSIHPAFFSRAVLKIQAGWGRVSSVS